MMAIARASFRSITRSPSAVVFTLLFPLVFILVFGFLENHAIRPEVALNPSSNKENPLYTEMKKSRGLNVSEDMSTEEMERLLEKGRIDAIINIRKQAGTAGPPWVLEVQTSSAAADKSPVLFSVLDQLVLRLNLKDLPPDSRVAEIQTTVVPGRNYTGIDFILPGQLGFSILSTGVFGTAFVFFSLRQTLVIKRFFTTPIKKPYILLGEALSRLVFSLLGALFIIAIGYFAFGFTLVHGMLTLLSMLLLSAFGLVVFMGFGFVISGLARNESMIPPLANIITLPQFLLSGTFFPIDSFPSWLQPVCQALPLTYLNEALRLVAFEGAGFSDIWTHVAVVLGWGLAVYALAIRFFRWE